MLTLTREKLFKLEGVLKVVLPNNVHVRLNPPFTCFFFFFFFHHVVQTVGLTVTCRQQTIVNSYAVSFAPYRIVGIGAHIFYSRA